MQSDKTTPTQRHRRRSVQEWPLALTDGTTMRLIDNHGERQFFGRAALRSAR